MICSIMGVCLVLTAIDVYFYGAGVLAYNHGVMKNCNLFLRFEEVLLSYDFRLSVISSDNHCQNWEDVLFEAIVE
jgi:hypothetical protein